MRPSPRRPARSASAWPYIGLLAFVVFVLWWMGCGARQRAPGPAAGPAGAAAPHSSTNAAARRAERGHPQPRESARHADGTGETETPFTAPSRPAAPGTEWQPQRPLLPRGAGRVAVIVDDVGYGDQALADFTAVGFPLTFSVLPQLDDSGELARACAAAGFEVMMHLPMEPTNTALNPGPGCVTVDLADDDIAALVERDLATVPGALGVNNHMGSRATSDERVMTAVLSALRRRGLFFVDSLTSGGSVAREVAAEVGVPCAARSVFLDTNFAEDTTSADAFFGAAQERVRQLGSIAQRRGSAIGICHYHPRTAEMLARLLPALRESGVEVVWISKLFAATGAGRGAPAGGAAPARDRDRYEPARDR